MSKSDDRLALLNRRIDLVIAMISSGQLDLGVTSIDEAIEVADEIINKAAEAEPLERVAEAASSKEGVESIRRRPIALRPDDAPPLSEEEILNPSNWIATDIPTWNQDTPVVDREQSFNGTEVVCLECGKSNKNLKTHLTMSHRMDADHYKARWGLAAEFPMEHPSKHAWRKESAKHLPSQSAEASKARTPEKDGPAVPIEDSVQEDHIVCLEDGKKLKMLKRHLRTAYGMTPAEYRAKWGLPSDYPMVAPKKQEERSRKAAEIGLGKGEKKPWPGSGVGVKGLVDK